MKFYNQMVDMDSSDHTVTASTTDCDFCFVPYVHVLLSVISIIAQSLSDREKVTLFAKSNV